MKTTTRRRRDRQNLRRRIERACARFARAITAWRRVAPKVPRGAVRALREALGWDQSELARRARVSQSAVSRIEHGSAMSASTALRLAGALRVSVEELMGGAA